MIVSVYPNVTEVLGRLKRSGRLRIPVVAAITDLAAMHYWASRGVDVHLVTHPEAIAEVRTIVGDPAPVHCVHGFTLPDFHEPRAEADARRALGLPETGKIVLVSGGGWGVGDVAGRGPGGARRAGREPGRVPLRPERRAAAASSAQFAGEERVRVEGFTDVMPEWMAAADALVHATGGLTVLEAMMRGCPAISYGWGRGHVRVNNAAFRHFGLADVVDSRPELLGAIERALAGGRTATDSFDGLPSAASFVLAAADAG